LLQSLQHRLEAEIDLLSATPGTETDTVHPEHFIPHYRQVYIELLNEQRQLLFKLNHKAEVDEDIIRKYLSLLDIEEEKLFVQYNHAH